VPGGADRQRFAERGGRHGLRGFLRAVRQVVGAPDYEQYLEHLEACHPDRAPLSPREYYLDFVRRRFGGGPTRCC
jgi:uncharacterized short protein YbdD (DUF466 family)